VQKLVDVQNFDFVSRLSMMGLNNKGLRHNCSKILKQFEVCKEIFICGVVTIFDNSIPRSYSIFNC